MLEGFLQLVFLLAAGTYLSFVITMLIGLFIKPPLGFTDDLKKISVIIAARNEELHIEACLRSVLGQTYTEAGGTFEVIVINDGSSDRTAIIVEALQTEFSNLNLFTTQGFGGKKPAIAFGITKATGDIIACTDADCLVPETWLAEIARTFTSDKALPVGFVSLPVLYHDEMSFFSKVQSLDFLAFIGLGASLIYLKRPAICNGANCAYLKKAFEEVGGFTGDRFSSGDDEALMRKVFHTSRYAVRFHDSPAAIVHTHALPTVRGFIRQRIRWASKGKGYTDVGIGFEVTLVLIYLFYVGLATGFILFPVLPFRGLAAEAFFAKCLLDFLFMARAASVFGKRRFLWYLLPAEIFQVFYVTYVGFIGTFFGYKWKGRQVTRQ
jgi:cellulose synthase/poly-beta-1,6-N-acetylglucosamine synthase-like glycosyltransferase